VFADADLEKAVPGASMGVYANIGQACVAGTRIFVQRSIHDEFVERMAEFSKTNRVGNGLDPETQIGPLISQMQLERVLNSVEIGGQEGARLRSGGRRLDGDLASGFFVFLRALPTT
jgi:aldehyde dehydrogenase (NAD+)